MHNQVEIRQRIMQALEEVIVERGTDGIRMGLIAQKANVSRVIIYRYFGSVQGLLDDYVRNSQLFPHFTVNHLDLFNLVVHKDVAQIWSDQLIQYFRQLRASKASREVIKASLIGDPSLSDTLSRTQHAELMGLVRWLSRSEEEGDPATVAILLGGMYYLTLMAHTNQPILGIDLRSERGWLQIEESIRTIYTKLSEPASATLSQRNHQASTQSQAA